MKPSKEWIEKYYPVEANKLVYATNEECIKHSIQKWEGLRNLQDYGLKLDATYKEVLEKDGTIILNINGETCALCQKHHAEDCNECPLAETLGMPCDVGNPSLYVQSFNDPNLMIEALKKCL